MKGTPPDVFSATVPEAEARLAARAERLGLEVQWIRHPHPGPEGEPLHLGLVRAGPRDASRVLVIYSGVHGVEGYAGSALQLAVLDELERGALEHQDLAVVLVHLANPWGAAWNRREDHENIDVFRNLIYSEKPVEADPLFDLVDDCFHWEEWRTQDSGDVKRRFDELAARHGFDALIAAIRRGQHHRPRAMSYHGRGPSWTKRALDESLPPMLAGARRIGVIDVHTGFGPPGHGTIMSYDAAASDKHRRVAAWAGEPLFVPGSDPNIPAHTGLPFNYMERQVPGSEVTALILEFGTLPPEYSRETFPDNHYAHVFGNPLGDWERAAAKRYRRFLYLEEEPWKAAVVANGIGLVRRVVPGLRSWPLP